MSSQEGVQAAAAQGKEGEREKAVEWRSPADSGPVRVYVVVSLAEGRVLAAVSSAGKTVVIRDPERRRVVVVLTVWGRALGVVANWAGCSDAEALRRASRIIRRQPPVEIV